VASDSGARDYPDTSALNPEDREDAEDFVGAGMPSRAGEAEDVEYTGRWSGRKEGKDVDGD
jgi:hypothetical protein